ncbi:hypothetical protein, partial [Bailinhaonella thermotolerans]|uniref:hypothetical protein n=1 Tax=Bailinhaonella thermotolerans TaxID=1070861 RepID=UPI001A8F6587
MEHQDAGRPEGAGAGTPGRRGGDAPGVAAADGTGMIGIPTNILAGIHGPGRPFRTENVLDVVDLTHTYGSGPTAHQAL